MNASHPPIETIHMNKIFCEWSAWEAIITIEQLFDVVQKILTKQGQLLTLWGSDERSRRGGFRLHLIFIFWKQSTLYIQCNLPESDPVYPDLSSFFPIANRLQRSLFDLFGFRPIDCDDQRPWLRHNSWPSNVFPLRDEVKLTDQFLQEIDHYSFVRVGGEGVHEIPVGPVHAGVIESGHFRFSVVGERILRLEERLGYTHKGIAKHFQHCTFSKGVQLAGRISGDSTVAYAWAYSMAIENLHQQTITPRAQWLRALLLERERIMNHLGDLGALGNDAGLSFGFSQFSRLKEMVLRLNSKLFGHRYLMDIIVPGGITVDLPLASVAAIQQEIQMLQDEVHELQAIYAEHVGLQDRFVATGIVSTELAQKLGLLGLVGRASGMSVDWRTCMPYAPYNQLNVRICTENAGDVAARVSVRFQEIEESLRLMEALLKLPQGPVQHTLSQVTNSRVGQGCVEGWRGPVFVIVCNKDAEHLGWVQIHDSSWQNWLALEHAVMGNIVPDFPLINKSFNLSYSGHDG